MKIFAIVCGLIAADLLYIWFAYVRKLGLMWNVLYWLVPVVFVLCFIAAARNFDSIYPIVITGILTVWLLPLLVFSVGSILGDLGRLVFHSDLRWFYAIWAVIGVCVSLCSIYALGFGWRRPVVRNVRLEFANLPQDFDGYRIAQISDLHTGTFDYAPGTVREIVDKINEQGTDLILFTGDMINTKPSEVEPYIEEFARLHAPDGVFSIMGNHDYFIYSAGSDSLQRRNDIARLQESERKAGFIMLLNENRMISRGESQIALVGVENPGFPDHADLDKAMDGIPDGTFRILMEHDPTWWRQTIIPSKTGIELTLAGHTHAMQMKVFGLSPARLVFREWGGLYSEMGQYLYVNNGTGGNLPFRWGAWPEITVFELRRAE